MDNPTKLHKLTVLSQLLAELIEFPNTGNANQSYQSRRRGRPTHYATYRYPLKLNEMPTTMTSLIKVVEELLPDIKRIIKN